MALVKCTECAGTVADTAPTCPHCGAPTPGGKTSKVVVSRKKAMTGFANRVEVLLDGREIASLKSGQSIEIEVAAGEHVLDVDSIGPAPVRPRQFTFEVASNQSASFECGFSSLSGFFVKQR